MGSDVFFSSTTSASEKKISINKPSRVNRLKAGSFGFHSYQHEIEWVVL
jgi:hypothetical protein